MHDAATRQMNQLYWRVLFILAALGCVAVLSTGGVKPRIVLWQLASVAIASHQGLRDGCLNQVNEDTTERRQKSQRGGLSR